MPMPNARIQATKRSAIAKKPSKQSGATLALALALPLASAAAMNMSCGGGDEPQDFEADATLAVKAYISTQLDALATGASELQSLSPAPDSDGWNMASDGPQVLSMRAKWRDIRSPYEKIEGAIAVLFPSLDESTDARYDGFVEEQADNNLFDAEGVTGVHAVERILWADEHPPQVVSFESALPHYEPARFPATAQQAEDFKSGLTARLAADTKTMRDQFEPLALDTAAAFRGVIGSIQEQHEKINLAASGEDESRYAQFTLADMRNNLEGGQAVFSAFKPWLEALAGGPELSAAITEQLQGLETAYAENSGEAIPDVPETWNPNDPTEADLATPYGKLWQRLSSETNINDEGSLVGQMVKAADLLGLPEI